MGWTERIERKTKYDEIIKYIESLGCFHDYRMGSLSVRNGHVRITIEEVIPAKHIADSTGLIWDFEFDDVSEISIDADTAFHFSIAEVIAGEKENELVFELRNGVICITANAISLGIPSK